MSTPQELTTARLHPRCDPGQFSFTSTAELDRLEGIIGQPRAVRALHFGMGMHESGYNVFVLGPAGTGKATAVRHFIEIDAHKDEPAADWVYVYNFKEPGRPKVLRLSRGMGRKLRDALQDLIKQLKRDIPAAFESEDYVKERDKIVNGLKSDQEQAFQQLTDEVEQSNFSLVRLPNGFVLAPMVNGKPITDAQFEKLADEQKEKLRKLREKLQDRVDETLLQMRDQEQLARRAMADFDRGVARFTVEHPISELQKRYADNGEISAHLEALKDDLVANVDAFKQEDDSGGPNPMAAMQTFNTESVLRRYSVNLFVDNAETSGAPVIEESNPNFANLVGRIEHQAVMGALITDFTMIRPGALHRANGGYLVLDVKALLERPQAWDALKRALKEQTVKVEEYAQSLGLISTAVLEPEPVPLDLKVVLYGTPALYYLLQAHDEDFDELFKVQADFDDRMPRGDETIMEYARFIATFCAKSNLKPFTPGAVAEVVDYGSRLVEHQCFLSTRFRDISDILSEAAYWAGQNGRDQVDAADVKQAVEERRYRGNRYEERMRDAIARGTLLVDVQGARVGQVNGLSVLPMGETSFGGPTRITAQIFMAQGGVIDIEREVNLGGPIHSKGVMILSSFLGGRYARTQPLSLHATLVFEQSYGGVEGDSASLAELSALISAIANIPIRQDLALTGSLNQHGDVQAIGGVNEKVEGFFDTCRAIGDLTGTQGVILPKSNVEHLVLRDDVVAAVSEGRFHLYPIAHVDEALELLMSMAAGEPDKEGDYAPDTINGYVVAALEEMNDLWQKARGNHRQEHGALPAPPAPPTPAS